MVTVLPLIVHVSHYHRMTAPPISVQFTQVFDEFRPQRIQVYIANKFPKIGVLIDYNGFVSVLK